MNYHWFILIGKKTYNAPTSQVKKDKLDCTLLLEAFKQSFDNTQIQILEMLTIWENLMTQLDELFIKINDQGRPSKKNISTFWDIYAFEYALVDNVLAFTLSIANIVPRV